MPECQKIKKGGFDQYGAERFGRLIFATIRKNAVWFKLTVTEMTINWNKSNPLTVTVTEIIVLTVTITVTEKISNWKNVGLKGLKQPKIFNLFSDGVNYHSDQFHAGQCIRKSAPTILYTLNLLSRFE